jgi:flagellar biosynthesis GTPase FlhF
VDVDTNKIKGIQTEKIEDELGEYARTLKNARKQGSGLRFPKSAIKSNPLRFRPYNREMVDENDPKVGTGKKPEGSDRRLYTDENPSDTVSVKFRTKQDIIDTLNKESFKSKSHKRQSQIINLIHQRVRAAYQNAKDPETKERLKRAYEYIEGKKEQSKQKTIRLQKQEQNESELTERCWAGYTQKGMKTMFGKRYPNCVKIKKK